MASGRRVDIDIAEIARLYTELEKSIPEISDMTGHSRSTIRARLNEIGMLRSRSDAIRLARDKGRLGSGARGKRRVFSDEWRRNLSTSLQQSAASRSRGVSVKRSGYIEYTRGQHKGRSQHVVAMEQLIGRPLAKDEVVHHIDHNRGNNHPSNLQLMSRSEHASLHAKENIHYRKRLSNGQFE